MPFLSNLSWAHHKIFQISNFSELFQFILNRLEKSWYIGWNWIDFDDSCILYEKKNWWKASFSRKCFFVCHLYTPWLLTISVFWEILSFFLGMFMVVASEISSALLFKNFSHYLWFFFKFRVSSDNLFSYFCDHFFRNSFVICSGFHLEMPWMIPDKFLRNSSGLLRTLRRQFYKEY